MTVPAATPAMPKPGRGPKPNPKMPLRATCPKQTVRRTLEGVRILPVPRRTDVKEFVSQILTAPRKAMFA